MKGTFNSDNPERLDNAYKGVSNPALWLDMAYDATKVGITTKTDVGTLLYNVTGKPYSLGSVNPSTGVIPPVLDSVIYASFESVNTILEGNYSATFVYNPENERAKMEVKQNGSTYLTRWYLGSDYIKETSGGVTREYSFVGGDAYTAPCVAIKQQGVPTRFYYLLRDHLGSITGVTDSTGALLYQYSYDSWGRMRNATSWVNYSPGSEPSLFVAGRGYTGHEHLPWFSAINMNGRLYDPLTGQFLSPDNNVQTPDFTQNLNRYGYCVNNPLKYTDPDGEIFWLIPVGIGALIGSFSGYHIGAAHHAKGLDMVGYILGGALIGGASGGAAAGVSAAVGGGAMLAGAAAGAVGGAGFSGLATGWNGDAMLKGALFGAISGLVGGGVGDAIGGGWGALAGGASSNLTSQLLYNGGDFGDVNWGSVGMSGAFSFGMYHGMQYASWKWGGGNKLGDLDITYRQFSKINTMYQRSHSIFGSRKENGVYINTLDGSARFVPRNDRYQDKVVFDDFRPGDAATAHSHLRNQMTYASNSHSPDDILNFQGYNSLVVGRIGSSTMMAYQNLPHVLIQSNPYLRFFLFPWWNY